MNANTKPCWAELSSPDLTAAQEFYGGLFGWEFASPGPMGFGVRALVGGAPVAGISPQPEQAPAGQPGFWSLYFKVAELTAFLEDVEEAGGTAMMAIPDFDEHASVALVADAAGTAFGALAYDDDRGFGAVGVDGATCWYELHTKDPAASAFYSTVFGWDFAADPAAGPGYETFSAGGELLGGMADISASEIPGHWESYIQVADVDATAARVEALGGALLAEPAASPRGRVGRFIDTHNAAFTVLAPAQR
ncbi:hypothetical protein GSY69_12590 [Brevibacterium sp. 5221]|uniref:VOC domain-containing protein n=1 Tax=Brevibacterium rongguiense TaxID=2695267 RepID=A0A6N9H9W1_9MICO|nr:MULTISPECIES: VOC family protein [Brevibacterium]MYM20775.1 hypothetical protein [Brevibacterium rongguiense]WAL41066.1 VOC family protein [Brevibacterium sp. BRM-1]